jgi:plastocyanin
MGAARGRARPGVRVAVRAGLAGGLVALAACGGGGAGGRAAGGRPGVAAYRAVPLSPGPRVRVEAIDNRFVPERVKVRAGSRVEFRNVGRNDHNVLPIDGGGFRLDVADFPPGAQASFRFAREGVYRYYCSLHGTARRGMIGVVVVVP